MAGVRSAAGHGSACCVSAIPGQGTCLSATTSGMSFAAMMIGGQYPTWGGEPGAGRALCQPAFTAVYAEPPAEEADHDRRVW
jgi:hypothetical protein